MVKPTPFERLEAKKALAERKLSGDTKRILKNQRKLVARGTPKKRRERSVNGGLFQMNFSI